MLHTEYKSLKIAKLKVWQTIFFVDIHVDCIKTTKGKLIQIIPQYKSFKTA